MLDLNSSISERERERSGGIMRLEGLEYQEINQPWSQILLLTTTSLTDPCSPL